MTAQRWGSLRNTAAVSQQAVDEKQSDWNAKTAKGGGGAGERRAVKSTEGVSTILLRRSTGWSPPGTSISGLQLSKSKSNDGAALFAVADIPSDARLCACAESYSAQLKNGMKATLTLQNADRTFDATIETTSRQLIRNRGLCWVELIADNKDGALTPGAFARVQF